MHTRLSTKEIGKRIMELRKLKGLSQQDLAQFLDIPRSSIAQIELGNRNVSVIELIKLSEALGFSLDKFLAKDYKVVKEFEPEEDQELEKQDIRISVPSFNKEKFKSVLLYILERCAGKQNVGETVLYKLLYFSDMDYYEKYEEHLTGSQYRKLPFGPVPQKLESILNKMMEEGELHRIKIEYHGYPQTRYLPFQKPDLTKISAAEKEVIDQVIDRFSDWSATKISEYSHNDKPWRATEENEVIDYELVFYRRPPYSVRVYEEED